MAVLRGWSKIRESCFEGEMQEEILSINCDVPHNLLMVSRSLDIFKKRMLLMERGHFGRTFLEGTERIMI